MTRRFVLAAGLAAASPLRANTDIGPGWSAARIGLDGRVQLTVAGAAQIDGDRITPETLFQAASCSKTANALLVLRLAADGVIDLDVPLNAQLGCWQLEGPCAHAATPAALLTHTAGTTVDGFPGYHPGEPLPDLAAILDGTTPANTPPVRCTSRPGYARYSGGGTMVLQALIEEVGSASWGEILSDRVLAPLGIETATIATEPEGVTLAHGHRPDGVPLSGGWMRHPEAAAAGLWITAEGLARVGHGILTALAGRPGALLPVALAERMIRPVSRGSAMGLFVHGSRIWHDGANFGFRSLLLLDMDRKEATAILTNSDSGELMFDHAMGSLG